jgi:molybdate transport system substrate-binding protein
MKGALFFLGFFLTVCCMATAQKVRVAFGAGMRDVAEALVEEFGRQTGSKITLVAASSEDVLRQLKPAPPFELWLTKEIGPLNDLYLKGHLTEKPKVFAKSNMVQVAGKAPAVAGGGDLQNLTRQDVKKIVVMAPAGSAQGKETVRMLHNAGIYDQVKEKLLFASNQSEMQYYLNTKAAEVGITSTTQAQKVGPWKEIDHTLYRPTEYGVALFKGNQPAQLALAQAFVRFLTTAKAKLILRNHGYEPV